jgi:hypothetical protein
VSYYDKQHQKVNVAHALQALGWTLHGYRPDQSDSMTDYWCPASWSGVATKDDFVICIDVGSARESGQPVFDHTPERGEDCAHCHTTGFDPSGWTLEAARADPRAYNRAMLVEEYGEEKVNSGQVTVGHPDVVSPVPFRDGKLTCRKCHGRGHFLKPAKKEVGRWPAFQANPGRSSWHVEKGGRIIAKGVGLNQAATKEGGHAMALKLVGYTQGAPAAAAAAPSVDGKILTTYEVQKHFHTKKQRDMWLVVVQRRLERDEWEAALGYAKAMSGWYSRAWGPTPGGFAFWDEEAARRFAGAVFHDPSEPLAEPVAA